MKPQRLIYSIITSICLFATACVNDTENIQVATSTLAPPQVCITITTAEPNAIPQPNHKTIAASITPTTDISLSTEKEIITVRNIGEVIKNPEQENKKINKVTLRVY